MNADYAPMRRLLIAALLVFLPQWAQAANFLVTNSQCLGAGSITEAINQANASQGPHTITIQEGLTVDVTLCPSPVPDAHPDVEYLFLLKENITIVGDGSGATILGHNQRVTTSGAINPLSVCSAPGDIIVASTPRLFRIGTKGQDNSRAKVTMRNLKVQGVAGIAAVWDRASLSLEDMWLREIFTWKSCELPAIEMNNGADLTLTRNRWEYVVNWSPTLLGFITNGSIAGTNAGNLTITDSEFSYAHQTGLISWGGSQGSQVNIVSSTTLRTGGIWVSGESTTHIVNSLIGFGDAGEAHAAQRISNTSSGDMTFTASTILYPSAKCTPCATQDEYLPGWIYRQNGSGKINLNQTAIGITWPDDPGPGLLLDPDKRSSTPGFTADTLTWIQPSSQQTAAALRSVTGQPALLTQAPGLGIEVDGIGVEVKRATPLLGTPSNPGLLIDAIDNAACGQVNALINPVDMFCITRDVIGNPRVDGNGKRDIGAVQISQSPALQVKDHTVDTVTVAWATVALTHLIGYQVEYRPVGSPSWSDGGQVSGTTLEKQVSGLTPGTRYEFRVTALEPWGPAGWSNVVAETPRAVPGIPPAFGLTRADQTINVSWGAGTAANGSPIVGFLVNFRPAGRVPPATFSSLMLPETATSAALTGLINGVTYEVEVLAVNGVGAGVKATGTATPQAAPTLSYPTPTTWPVGTALTLNPLAGGLIGTGAYQISGILPAGMTLNSSTGLISGTPTTPGPVNVLIVLTDGGTGLSTTYLMQFSLIAPPTPPPTLAYPSPITAQQGSPLSTVTPSVGNLSAVPSVNATYLQVSFLPSGLTLNADGTITGTPTQHGKQISTIRVTDNNTGLTADAQIFFNISAPVPAPTLAYAAPASWNRGTALTLTPQYGHVAGTPGFSLASGSLPAGMTLNPDGTITGTPTTIQATTATIQLTDGGSGSGLSTLAVVTLNIVAPPSPPPTLSYPAV